MKLYIDGKEAVKGQVVTDFRGDKAILVDWRKPHKPSSTGRVIVELPNGDIREYYPSVYNGEFKREELPEMCYALDEVEKRVILIKRGEQGFYKTNWPAGYTQEMVDKLNEKIGVTKAQAEAMIAGSMFGWDVPAADPNNY